MKFGTLELCWSDDAREWWAADHVGDREHMVTVKVVPDRLGWQGRVNCLSFTAVGTDADPVKALQKAAEAWVAGKREELDRLARWLPVGESQLVKDLEST